MMQVSKEPLRLFLFVLVFFLENSSFLIFFVCAERNATGTKGKRKGGSGNKIQIPDTRVCDAAR